MKYTDFSSKLKNIICKGLAVVPTKTYLKVMYKIKTGRKLNLKNPVAYSEKINWMKIYDKNPLYTQLADKYEVRKYVSERIGEEHLIPLLGIWDKFDDINFDELPENFVLKCTHDFGSVVLVDDKSKMDVNEVKKAINSELKYNFYYRGREWVYKNIKPRIIAEQYMNLGRGRLIDYKFFCFGGKVEYLYVVTGRGGDVKYDFRDRNFNHVEMASGDVNPSDNAQKPEVYDQMIVIAEKLADGIKNVRVDLYDIDGKIYFGEMTFYHAGGMSAITPYEMDVKFGESFIMEKYDKK